MKQPSRSDDIARYSSEQFGTMLVLIAATMCVLAARTLADEVSSSSRIQTALLAASDLTQSRLTELQQRGFTSIAIELKAATPDGAAAERRAAELVLESSLELYYWVEVARCPELADAHPEWMASLQTHDEWRRFFPDAPEPQADEVAKTYPWVPILSREPYAAQLLRVQRLLKDKPRPTGVFLNDLQGAPSACGCGHPLCRWTSDYGDRRTTTPLGDDAATLFVGEIRKSVPDSVVIPVWTTECEQHDGAKDGLCAGVGCFEGACWRAYTRQLMPLQQANETIAVLAPYRAFQRDLPIYGPKAGWIKHAIDSFATMPPQRGGTAIPASRLIAVLQGWDVDASEINTQISVANAAGAKGYVVSFIEIEQSWQPRIVRWK